MIEPTESENLNELDKFCEALNSIYTEITSDDDSKRNAQEFSTYIKDVDIH